MKGIMIDTTKIPGSIDKMLRKVMEVVEEAKREKYNKNFLVEELSKCVST